MAPKQYFGGYLSTRQSDIFSLLGGDDAAFTRGGGDKAACDADPGMTHDADPGMTHDADPGVTCDTDPGMTQTLA